jgi:hypothetical protein
METKFIEGTNEQYSIREDGNVIQHYKKHRVSNTRIDKIYNDKIVTILKGNCVDITTTTGVIRFSINTLTLLYFNFIFCKKCNTKFTPSLKTLFCNKCKKNARKKTCDLYYNNNKEKLKTISTNWRNNNREKFNKTARKSQTKHKDKILAARRADTKKVSRNYVAGVLRITVSNLSDEMYVHHKNLILLKRKIAKENNLNINSLK